MTQWIQENELLALRPDAPRPRDDLLRDEQILRLDYGPEDVTANVLRVIGGKHRYYLRMKDSGDPEAPPRWVTPWPLGRFLHERTIQIANYPGAEVLKALRRLKAAEMVEVVRGHGWALTPLGVAVLGVG